MCIRDSPSKHLQLTQSGGPYRHREVRNVRKISRKGHEMTARPRNKRTTEQSGETVRTAAGAATKARTGWSPAVSVRWLEIPQKHDYPAAASYLSLLAGPAKIRALVSALKSAPVAHYMAKDILRASGLPLLPEDDVHAVSY